MPSVLPSGSSPVGRAAEGSIVGRAGSIAASQLGVAPAPVTGAGPPLAAGVAGGSGGPGAAGVAISVATETSLSVVTYSLPIGGECQQRGLRGPVAALSAREGRSK
ncbi:hypothetical protein FNX44_005385 [Streptomyces sp. OF1]|uniref:Uncharacterized protein n=1 Tax=Streptomyces alkaliterrae TaxID=2213162 RepID=A0A5P0YLX5_9ACTN|nr:hypothetical protein [Streptomyces alkaliterrae]